MDEADKRSKAEELFSLGVGATEVGRIVGLPRSTVWRWQQKLAEDKEAAPVDQLEAKEMELAALRAQLKIAEGTRPEVVPAYSTPPEQSPEARWKAAELDNAEHIRKAMLMAKFSVELPNEPVAITFVSDQHISIGNTVDLRRMREDAELIAANDNCFAILGGDATDNHIKHRSAVLAAHSQPSDQFELFEWYLSIFSHRILVTIAGNHDLWTNQFAGVDVLSGLLKNQRVCYAPDEALLDLRVGQQRYRVGMRHQYRMNSTMNQTHCVKQWMRNDEDMDIGCIGHHHVGAIEPFYQHGQERWTCRPGSYQITSAYSRQFGYGTTRPTCPTFVIFPNERKIVGFHQLADGLTFLKAVRG
jgi:hypothetical protein